MRLPILARLAAGEVIVADGATGTMLQEAGLPAGAVGEAWVLERPQAIRALHRAYLDAGSQLILTATFGGTRSRLRTAGLASQVQAINRRAAELAREEAGEDVYVAGDMGPTGELMAPLGNLTYTDAVEMFSEQAAALAEGGTDVVYIETMSDLSEAKAAVQGAQQGCNLPVFCTFSFDHKGRTAMGVSPTQAAQGLHGLGVAALGANCGHAPEEVLDILPQMQAAAPGCFLIAKPNAGIPRLVKRRVVYDATPERLADLTKRYVALGASIVGACCGSSPAHIAAMRASVLGSTVAPAHQ